MILILVKTDRDDQLKKGRGVHLFFFFQVLQFFYKNVYSRTLL
jgi:hypothetical protein